MRFLDNNIAEIQSSRKLQIFGISLCISHILTFLFWWKRDYQDADAICWPFFPNCKVIVNEFLRNCAPTYLLIYLVLSLFAIFLFFRKDVRAAYCLFAFVSAMKLAFHLSDYHFMGNYHYMSHIINFSFLFLLSKENCIKIFLVLFYMAAGLLKFNTEWISGFALVRPVYLDPKVLEWLCAYAILIELFWVPFLVLPYRLFAWFAFFQIFCFHLFSWQVVGWFYPCIMFTFLSIYILFPLKFQFPKRIFARVCIGAFVIAQLYTFAFEPLSSITGRGRILSLNMLDASSVCDTHFLIKFKDHQIDFTKKFEDVGTRVRCDMLLVSDYAKSLCSSTKLEKDFVDIDLDHQVHKMSDASTIVQTTFSNICKSPVHVGFLGDSYQESEISHD